jgi:hypothetical protein
MKPVLECSLLMAMIISQEIYMIQGEDNFTCFGTIDSNSLHSLVYSDRSEHPVKIPYLQWSSVQISAHMTNILLREKMRYNAVLVPVDALLSEIAVNLVAGCIET